MYYFIINPKAKTGQGSHIWKKVKQHLEKEKISYTYYFTHYEFHAIKIAQKICKNHTGKKTIVVIGGDGTVNEVLNGITDFDSVFLGYIPAGSSNDLARCLKLPDDPIEILTMILHRKHYNYYDQGLVSFPNLQGKKSRRFAVSTGIGFDAAICYEALHSNLKKLLNKLHLGKLTYVLLAIKQVLFLKHTNATLILDQKTTHSLPNLYFVATMVHPYEGGGLYMTPGANPKDQTLNVCAIYDIPKYKVYFYLPLLFFGWHKHIRHGILLTEAHQVEVLTEQDLIVHTDGEYAGKTNHIKVQTPKEKICLPY